MRQQQKHSFIDTRGWDVKEEIQQINSNSYSILARSLQRNIKNYVDKNKVSNQKSLEKIKALSTNKRLEPIKKRYQKVTSEQSELPLIAKGNKEILVVKTIDIDQKIKPKQEKEEKAQKYFNINLLSLPLNDQNRKNEQKILEKLQKQSNRKYERIREYRFNKTSRRLYLHFKSKEEMQALTQKTLEEYLVQRTKRHSLQLNNVFSLPVVSR